MEALPYLVPVSLSTVLTVRLSGSPKVIVLLKLDLPVGLTSPSIGLSTVPPPGGGAGPTTPPPGVTTPPSGVGEGPTTPSIGLSTVPPSGVGAGSTTHLSGVTTPSSCSTTPPIGLKSISFTPYFVAMSVPFGFYNVIGLVGTVLFILILCI